MMRNLTQREREVYNFIAESIKEKGYAPSVRDICEALGFKSTSTVHMYINRLNELGVISKEDGKSRALRLDNDDAHTSRVPLLGRVTAGQPILAQEDFEGYVRFASESVHCRQDNLFALHVTGESMIEAGILDGDIVIVDKRTWAEDGEIVVALIGDEATVKTFYRDNGRYRLQPENKKMKPIIVDTVSVIGKVVASFRIY